MTVALSDGSQKRYPNDAAFVLIGADPPIAWLEKMGIRFIERAHQYQMGKTDDVLQTPLHPYTRLLLSAVPDPEAGLRQERLPSRSARDLGAFGPGTQLLEQRPGHYVRESIT